MFGSDQMLWPQRIEDGIEAINSAEFLTEEQKRDIFYNNAVKLFLSNKKYKRNICTTKDTTVNTFINTIIIGLFIKTVRSKPV